jgi:transaldolase
MAESEAKKAKLADQFDQLSKLTTIVADTGDVDAIKKYAPTDATTNPSLIFKAAQMEQYKPLVEDAIAFGKSQQGSEEEKLAMTLDRLSVNFGKEILKIVPGYVSTEVDARLSFDTEGTLMRARRIIGYYKDAGIPKERILIKIASTWEGIRACEILEKEGISCNMTLLFSLAQAAGCAEAGATLISPFVGRIMDWWKKKEGKEGYAASEDPGVLSVQNIYKYYKAYGYKTIVMGASFRNKGEILELAGVDRLTISPGLLDELKGSSEEVKCILEAGKAATEWNGSKVDVSEPSFRFAMNEDACATEKTAEGIRGFSADLRKLEDVVRGMM